MDESIKKQLEDIDKKGSKVRKKLELEVQPLARAIKSLLYTSGAKRGFIRSYVLGRGRRKFHAGDLEVSGEGYFTDKISVSYKGEIVLYFNISLCYADVSDSKWGHLIVYKSGEWEDLVVQEYRKMVMGDLEEKFDISDDE